MDAAARDERRRRAAAAAAARMGGAGASPSPPPPAVGNPPENPPRVAPAAAASNRSRDGARDSRAAERANALLGRLGRPADPEPEIQGVDGDFDRTLSAISSGLGFGGLRQPGGARGRGAFGAFGQGFSRRGGGMPTAGGRRLGSSPTPPTQSADDAMEQDPAEAEVWCDARGSTDEEEEGEKDGDDDADTVFVPCEVCGDLIPMDDLIDHTATCNIEDAPSTNPSGSLDGAVAAQSRRSNAAIAAARRAAGRAAPTAATPAAQPTAAEASAGAATAAASTRTRPRPRDQAQLAAVAAAAEQRGLAAAAAKRQKVEAERPGIVLRPAPDGATRKIRFNLETLETLYKVGTKIAGNPDPKYRRVRVTHPKFNERVWRHAHARELLEMTGWAVDDADADHILLPPDHSPDELLSLIRSHPYVDAAEEEARKRERERVQRLEQIKKDKRADAERRRQVTMAIQRDRDRHTNEKFFNALRNGRAEVLSKIVDAHPELLSTLDTGGRPPLLVAAGGGFTECIEMLVAKDAPLDATSLGGETAVHAAAAAGQLEAIELLLGLGCTLDAPDRSQSTPLALAAANGQGSAVQILLANGASAIHEDVCGRTPLFRATWAGSVEAVLALLSAPSVDIEAKDVEGCTSLAAAAFKNHVEVLQVLIDRGADTMAMDTRGRTPLIRAAISNSGETAAILLDAGVPVDGTDTHGATAAWYACSEDSPAVLSQLLDRDCDLNLADARFSQTPIDVAFDHAARRCIDLLREVPGLELPELPDDMFGYDANSDVSARRGYELVPSSLEELERIVDEGGRILPRRIAATFEGEEAYGDGPTRQWIAQLGREILSSCSERVDWPSRFSVAVVDTTVGAAAHVLGGSAAMEVDRTSGCPKTFRLSQYGDEGGASPDGFRPTLVRGRVYTLYMRQSEHEAHPLCLQTDADGDASVAVREDRATCTATADPRSGVVILTLTLAESCPNRLYLASEAPDFKPIIFDVVDNHFCQVHGPCRKDRCCLVESSDLLAAGNDTDAMYHMVSVSPITDPDNNESAARLLTGLGRSLGIAVCTGCPIGVALSPAFCKLLRGEADLIHWEDLRAVLPMQQFSLLQQCLDPQAPREHREACVEVWIDATGHDTFVTSSVESMRKQFGLTEDDEEEADDELTRTVSATSPDGAERKITVDSMPEYAECLASKLLITNVSSHMKLIRRGIRDVRGAADKLRSVAGWQALQATLLGSLEIKVDEWKRAVDMQGRGGERSTTSSTADNFWRAVDSLSNEDRRKLLFFWTAESPPAAGLSHLDRRMTLRIDTSLAPNQPRAATCFYSLEIPVLSSRSAAEKLVKTCVAHWNTWGHE